MALTSVLVDRARILQRVGTGKVQGRPIIEEVPSEWFKARLFLPAATERADSPGRRRRVIKNPQLLFGVKDLVGGVIVPPKADERIELQSDRFGNAVWRVDGEPEFISKRRRVIGYYANLSRVEEPQRVDV